MSGDAILFIGILLTAAFIIQGIKSITITARGCKFGGYVIMIGIGFERVNLWNGPLILYYDESKKPQFFVKTYHNMIPA